MSAPNEQNGHEPKASQAAHDNLRTYVKARFDELDDKVDYLVEHMKMTGQALELLLKERGLELPEDE